MISSFEFDEVEMFKVIYSHKTEEKKIIVNIYLSGTVCEMADTCILKLIFDNGWPHLIRSIF